MKGEVFGGFATSAWSSGCQVRIIAGPGRMFSFYSFSKKEFYVRLRYSQGFL